MNKLSPLGSQTVAVGETGGTAGTGGTDAPDNVGALARRGVLLVISSPSGAGKTTLSRNLLTQEPAVQMSVSYTTRPPRPGERDGVDYTFLNDQAFADAADAGELLEHAIVFGNRYGTPRAPVETALRNGHDVLFDIDWQGARQLRQQMPDDVVSVFILPPSAIALAQRLAHRGSDDADVVAARMAQASEEMSHWREYDYVVVNAVVDEAGMRLRQILAAERQRRFRSPDLQDFVDAMRRRLEASLD